MAPIYRQSGRDISDVRLQLIVASTTAITPICLLMAMILCGSCCRQKKKNKNMEKPVEMPSLADQPSIARKSISPEPEPLEPVASLLVVKQKEAEASPERNFDAEKDWSKKASEVPSLEMENWKDKGAHGSGYNHVSSGYHAPNQAPNISLTSSQEPQDNVDIPPSQSVQPPSTNQITNALSLDAPRVKSQVKERKMSEKKSFEEQLEMKPWKSEPQAEKLDSPVSSSPPRLDVEASSPDSGTRMSSASASSRAKPGPARRKLLIIKEPVVLQSKSMTVSATTTTNSHSVSITPVSQPERSSSAEEQK